MIDCILDGRELDRSAEGTADFLDGEGVGLTVGR